MRFVRDNQQPRLSAGSVVAVGSFDGMHTGHRTLIRHCRTSARDGLDAVVLTFEPLPEALFRPLTPPARITSVRQKLALFRAWGMDLVWMMRFNQALAAMPAADFVQEILVDALGVRHLVIGDDFRFGRAREGDLGMLLESGTRFGFQVDAIEAVRENGERVSSSAIRHALQAGDFAQAERLLGRAFTVEGRVYRGSQLGRRLGYPTANLRPAAEPCPLHGVFAVRARVLGPGAPGTWLDGVASLGWRPAVGGTDFVVEVHLFDFDQDLYGRRLEVGFVQKLRDEADFDDMDALVAQMREDERHARRVIAAQA
ncbi:MAG: bifunctional riboflavin kinase/FAD synthetase [Xanthomonadales bacterium]|nr:bifunctional riboflavin kinase/FAD synthetase [Xanthomonadales bacterium]NIN58269.1 bifunctional riboflavin kinase/FAD synthetase [Xanthomonadales bacterium]NIN73614.1 bifunctional riboflavin kinase/FAD synthetase [Xanthomonadales bacterium]NIO14399.1 bifunctional riboflavin kinase/FAD synthetase [Xanthomonadales bacterium]NIP10662.1 bifunctional riboflavin kinase/FAD synthetase [Xanthomonadales bacterium]